VAEPLRMVEGCGFGETQGVVVAIVSPFILFKGVRHHLHLHSFPTRRSSDLRVQQTACRYRAVGILGAVPCVGCDAWNGAKNADRSEEHTSELQSRSELVCRLPPEKKTRAVRAPRIVMAIVEPDYIPGSRVI